MKFHLLLSLLFMFVAANVSGNESRAMQQVEIRFAFRSGQQDLACGAAAVPLGRTATPSHLVDARFYVYGVALVDANGVETPLALVQDQWQYTNVALLDFEDGSGGEGGCEEGTPAINRSVRGTVPKGKYLGLKFVIGVPVLGKDEVSGKVVSLNHSSHTSAPAPLNSSPMSWSWQVGRKFMKIEIQPENGRTRSNGKKVVWPFHLGSTGCQGNPVNGEIVTCSRPNRLPVHLPSFDPAKNLVVLDVAELFFDADLNSPQRGEGGCMSSLGTPGCQALFDRLGLNLGDSSPGADDAGEPRLSGPASRVFRVEEQ